MIKRIFKLNDIKYSWLLAISMVLFIVSLCFNRLYPEAFTKMEVQIYGADVAIAVLWSILNYMANLKIRNIYKKHDDIDEFVKQLPLDTDDKEELIQYLNDFAKDLEQNGLSHAEAMKTAISHFQAKEFASASQSDIFDKPSHHYLFGYITIFALAAIATRSIGVLTGVFWLAAMAFTLGLYAFALLCLFIIYKFSDAILAKK